MLELRDSKEGVPHELRHVVADTLHQSLSEIMAPSIQHVAAINTIGAYFLTHVTGDTYLPAAGSVIVRCAGTELRLIGDPSRIDEHEYYVWIERDGAGGVELIDFASRYWQDWAKSESRLWLGDAPPPVVWDSVRNLDAGVVQYVRDETITHVVRTALHNVFKSPNRPEQVVQWEHAINRGLELLAEDPRVLEYMVRTGAAKPLDRSN